VLDNLRHAQLTERKRSNEFIVLKVQNFQVTYFKLRPEKLALAIPLNKKYGRIVEAWSQKWGYTSS
jgi:hypothetical protein